MWLGTLSTTITDLGWFLGTVTKLMSTVTGDGAKFVMHIFFKVLVWSNKTRTINANAICRLLQQRYLPPIRINNIVLLSEPQVVFLKITKALVMKVTVWFMIDYTWCYYNSSAFTGDFTSNHNWFWRDCWLLECESIL